VSLGVLFSLIGAAAGALAATSLARAARRVREPLGALGRLLLVGAVLAVSARSHHLGPAALGWAAGWLANGAREYRRMS
jgi:hypothetical protein